MPTIEISEEAYALLKAESEHHAALMAASDGEWFLVNINEIADTILLRELAPDMRREDLTSL